MHELMRDWFRCLRAEIDIEQPDIAVMMVEQGQCVGIARSRSKHREPCLAQQGCEIEGKEWIVFDNQHGSHGRFIHIGEISRRAIHVAHRATSQASSARRVSVQKVASPRLLEHAQPVDHYNRESRQQFP